MHQPVMVGLVIRNAMMKKASEGQIVGKCCVAEVDRGLGVQSQWL
jgi:hypothetical protein